MIDALSEDTRVQMAGQIGRYFRTDPVMILKADYFTWAVRVAAYDWAATKEAEAQQAAVAKAKRR